MRIKKDPEKAGFFLLMVCLAGYYLYRMFALNPWYDELYTYYYFISRGPVYAAIHWPLPNNHVGYSVLSGFLDYLGNPYIGLRGVSFLCALVNPVLLFGIGRRYLRRGLSLTAVMLYLSMNLVNQLAVQGRGYTLGITCFLAAVLCLSRICGRQKDRRIDYIIFSLCLVLGLYTLTSDVYWVLAVCFAGGIFLLYRGIAEAEAEKKKLYRCGFIRRLRKLVAASLAAAFLTLALYGVLWLAIGSNLLVKEEGGRFFGMGHVEVILKAPFSAVSTGISYMLATPYIQSVERRGFMKRFGEWLLSLFNWYYDGFSLIIAALFILGAAFLLVRIIKGMREREGDTLFLPLFLLFEIVATPVFLILQCALPYYRVFSYGGAVLALLCVFLLQQSGKRAVIISGFVISVQIAFFSFGFKGYQNQYSMREYEIQDALTKSGIDEEMTLCVTDCTQQYLIRFLFGITCENTQIEGADLVLLDKRMTDPDFDEMVWEFYHYYDTIPWDYMEEAMEPVYENKSFVLYKKR